MTGSDMDAVDWVKSERKLDNQSRVLWVKSRPELETFYK